MCLRLPEYHSKPLIAEEDIPCTKQVYRQHDSNFLIAPYRNYTYLNDNFPIITLPNLLIQERQLETDTLDRP